jgi:hypothetical protein
LLQATVPTTASPTDPPTCCPTLFRLDAAPDQPRRRHLGNVLGERAGALIKGADQLGNEPWLELRRDHRRQRVPAVAVVLRVGQHVLLNRDHLP